jgi:ADP-ribose pyrophosphatase YjhB (NUDIX family)
MRTFYTVKAVIQDKDGNILLLRRSKTHPTQALQMDLPGGMVERTEELVDTLLREVAEETSVRLEAGSLKLVFAIAGVHGEKSVVQLLYAATTLAVKPDITLSWEHDQFGWLPLGQAAALLDPSGYQSRALTYVAEHDILSGL